MSKGTLGIDRESSGLETAKSDAVAKLSQRLAVLAQIQAHAAIDTTFITCAEYQLFIDEKLQTGESHQPDHWSTLQFPVRAATQPIVGVRARDAEAFCEWLNHGSLGGVCVGSNNRSQQYDMRSRYRLPTLAEIAQDPTAQKQIGAWCIDQGHAKIAGIAAEQWKIWRAALADAIARGLDFDLSRDLDLPLHLGDDDRARDSALERVRNRDKNFPHIWRLHNRVPDLERLFAIDLASLRQAARGVARALGHASKLDRDLSMYYRLARDLDQALGRADTFGLLRTYLLCNHLLWDLLAAAVDQAARVQSSAKYRALVAEYAAWVDRSFHLYAYVVLIDERRAGNIPAWEGIRIVREQVAGFGA